MKTATIKLTGEVLVHGEPVKEIVIREPRGAELFSLGEPVLHSHSLTGGVLTETLVENDEIIRAYLNRCLEAPRDPSVFDQLSLADAKAVKKALLDFFPPDGLTLFGSLATESSLDTGTAASKKSVN